MNVNELRRLLTASLRTPAVVGVDSSPALIPGRGQRPPRAASVLVGVVPRPAGPAILLTRRTGHLTEHAGEVSFPGGRLEPGDSDLIATALRESEEELGLGRCHVEVLGTLPDYHTITDYTVTPVLALVDARCKLNPDPREVDAVFELPLEVLRDPSQRARHSRQFRGVDVRYWVIRYDGHLVWGATAAILVGLSTRLDRVDPASRQ